MKVVYVLIAIVFMIVFAVWYMTPVADDCRILRVIRTENGNVEIVNPECKEGLPHTTGPNTMRFTEDAWSSPRRNETLVHERVHLAQKRNPTDWTEFYRRVWDYEILTVPPADVPPHKIRKNPDTEDAPWAVWRRRYVFYPVSPTGTLRNAQVMIWDRETKQIISDPPSEWRALFCDDSGCPHQYEHPHEIAAEYIARGNLSPAAKNLFTWYK
jgi:hypothetical protein